MNIELNENDLKLKMELIKQQSSEYYMLPRKLNIESEVLITPLDPVANSKLEGDKLDQNRGKVRPSIRSTVIDQGGSF